MERIRASAKALFMQYGLRSVSMDDIAGNLGMSKKTIYQYFADKDELVNAVVANMIDTNQTVCNADRSQADNAVHEIFLAMDMVVDMFRYMNPSLLFDMQKYHPAAFGLFLKHKHDYLLGIITDNLHRGIAEELYRSDIKVDLLARYRVETIIIPFNPEFYKSMDISFAEIEQELTYHFLFGIVSQKGYKLSLKYKQERLKKSVTTSNKKVHV